ncbi:LPS-assembly protein [Alphaproteobacteria bacterium]
MTNRNVFSRTHKFILILLYYLCILFLGTVSTYASANNKADVGNLSITTNHFAYNEQKQEGVAEGNVKITHKGYVITADNAIINRLRSDLFAKHNVTLVNTVNNDTYYAEEVQYNYSTQQIHVLKLETKLAHNIRISAHKVETSSQNTYICNDFAFTTCQTTARSAPLWQVKAKTAVIQKQKEQINYKDVYITIFGYNVAYLPFFQTPTPNVKRKSGFLFPKIAKYQNLGPGVQIPYYLSVTPNFDITFSPTLFFSSNTSLMHDLEIRHKLQSGGYNFKLVALPETKIGTYDKYFKARGNFCLNQNNEYGISLEKFNGANKLALKEYKITDNDILISNSYWNYYFGNNGYFTLNPVLIFNDLRSATSGTAFGAPRMQFYYETQLHKNLHKGYSSRILFNGDFINVINNDGTSIIRHLNTGSAIDFEYINKYGHVFNIQPMIAITGEAYGFNVKPLQQHGTATNTDNYAITPKLTAGWRWPLYSKNTYGSLIVEPLLNFTLAGSKKHNPSHLSQIFQSTNFIDNSLTTTLRSIDYEAYYGNKLDFGLKNSFFTYDNFNFSLLIGGRVTSRNIPKSQNDLINGPDSQKLQRPIIYTLQGTAEYGDTVISDRLMLNSKGKPIHNELDVQFNLADVQAALDYTFDDGYITQIANYKNEIGLNLWYKLAPKWWINAGLRAKFGEKPKDWKQSQIIQQGIGIRYRTDCLQVDLGIMKDMFKYKDFKRPISYTVNVSIPLSTAVDP